jgi:hypothetical protein
MWTFITQSGVATAVMDFTDELSLLSVGLLAVVWLLTAVMLQISSFRVRWLRMTTSRGGSRWAMFPCSVPTVKAQRSSRRGSKPTGPNAIGVKTDSASGGSSSYSIRTGDEHPTSVARWSTWLSTAVASAILSACCV